MGGFTLLTLTICRMLLHGVARSVSGGNDFRVQPRTNYHGK